MASWRDQLFTKAWEDPKFFQRLLDQRDEPEEVLSDAGISLSEDDLEALRQVLSADKLTVELDWNSVEELVEQSLARGGGIWRDMRPWILGVWRP